MRWIVFSLLFFRWCRLSLPRTTIQMLKPYRSSQKGPDSAAEWFRYSTQSEHHVSIVSIHVNYLFNLCTLTKFHELHKPFGTLNVHLLQTWCLLCVINWSSTSLVTLWFVSDLWFSNRFGSRTVGLVIRSMWVQTTLQRPHYRPCSLDVSPRHWWTSCSTRRSPRWTHPCLPRCTPTWMVGQRWGWGLPQ